MAMDTEPFDSLRLRSGQAAKNGIGSRALSSPSAGINSIEGGVLSGVEGGVAAWGEMIG